MLEPMTTAKKLATFADLAALPERPTMEIIHGELVEKAMGGLVHSLTEFSFGVWLGRRFARPVGGRWPGGWRFHTELHVEYEPHEVYCHDLCGFRLDGPVPVDEWPVKLRPDWVCEIISPGHEKRDEFEKFWTLFRARVPHYWLVDRENRFLRIHRWEPHGYLALPPIGEGQTVRAEPFEAVELRTNVLFGLEPDDE